MELIGRTSGNKAFGLTIPLVTKSDGTKFGKTASGAIWLDAAKTSPYQFYQFWVNTDDQDVVKLLKYYTFLDPEEISRLETAVREQPEKREAQRVLAKEVTELVHGKEVLESAINITRALFDGNVQELTETEIAEAFKDVPSTTIEDERLGLLDLLVAVKAAPSKRQARQDVESGAVSVNGVRTSEMEKKVGEFDKLAGNYLVIRRGKKNYYLVKLVK
jgi:tyrosyl-tRNA synthetase